ncbi:MAG TPA: AraC family transcriptional regulator [Solimonas sp.]|nr:AraC family transcriptional regulator [Solimonas sp.]
MLKSPEDRVLDSALTAYQLHASVTDSASYCGRWHEPEPAVDACVFHLIGSGECRVQAACLPAEEPLGPGDLVIFPRGAAHRLDGDGYTTMLCGQFDFVCGHRNPLLDALPDCLIVRETEAGSALRRLAQLMSEESHSEVFGSRAVLDKLADSLFVMSVRHYLGRTPQRRGLLAALADPQLGRALAAMHAEPGRDWSVASLASSANMSRTRFAEEFARLMGQTPIQYLTQWRMMSALRLLRDPRQSVLGIAEQLGYRTEAAFRRGFKRIHGHGPGHFRRAG